ncbi:MAG: RNA methyltransferase [Sphaerochaetaceae bacterium]|nr:RNA methyltransferase [Sphaerochaetaceae bacterium]
MEENLDLTEELRQKIQIVLVEPQDGANIGSCCRAMKTMGLSRLVLVTDRFYDEQRIFTLALHAKDIYKNCRRFSSLALALSDSTLAVAATRRHGKKRKGSFLSPEDLSNLVNKSSKDELISIVFGRESDGLSDEEVSQCNTMVTIPTSPAFPSLNLSQAVQIITYTLYKGALPFTGNKKTVTIEKQKEIASHIARQLEESKYFKSSNEIINTEIFLKDIIGRSAMTDGEVQYLDKIFTKLAQRKIHSMKEK